MTTLQRDHISKEDVIKRTDELIKNLQDWLPNKVDKLLMSGAIELEDWEDTYYLPKLILRALAKEIDHQYKGLESNKRRDNKAIKNFYANM